MAKRIIDIIGIICLIHIGIYSYFKFRFDFLLLIFSWVIFFGFILYYSIANRKVIKQNNYFKITLRELPFSKRDLLFIVGYIIIGIIFYYFKINSILRKIESKEFYFFVSIFLFSFAWRLWFNTEIGYCYITPLGIEEGIFLKKVILFDSLEKYFIDDKKATIIFASKGNKECKYSLDRGFLYSKRIQLEELLNRNIAR